MLSDKVSCSLSQLALEDSNTPSYPKALLSLVCPEGLKFPCPFYWTMISFQSSCVVVSYAYLC